MKKWLQKNRDSILVTAIGGVIAFIIFEILKLTFGYFSYSKAGIFNFLIKVSSFSINISVLHVLLFLVFVAIFYRISNKIKIRNRKLIIVKATYGTADKFVDITRELNNAVADNKLKIVLSNNIAGDPHSGVVKNGWIKYKFNGKEFEREHREGDVIELP